MSRKALIIIIACLCLIGLGLAALINSHNNQSQAINISKCGKGSNSDPSLTFRCLTDTVTIALRQDPDPATLLPQVEIAAQKNGVSLLGTCHVAMHQSGRIFAQENHVTLANLRRYLPRSDGAGCPSGFAHGMITEIGLDQGLDRDNITSLLAVCARETTRARQYSCVHGIGHGLRRSNESDASAAKAIAGCRALGRPMDEECAVGVYHDLFFSLSGVDNTRDQGLSPSANKANRGGICARQPQRYARQCWYRYLLAGGNGNRISGQVAQPSDIARLCDQVPQSSHSACLTGAATKIISFQGLVAECRQFTAKEASACVAGSDMIAPEYLTTGGSQQQALRLRRQVITPILTQCSTMPGSKAQQACAYWLGFRSVRSIALDSPRRQTIIVCSGLRSELDNSLYRRCLDGIDASLRRVVPRRATDKGVSL